MEERMRRLAELAAHGANVQQGQVVLVNAELGHEELARAVAAAAYDRGARFVDVNYFDPHVKRARIAHADPGTLEYVPPWYGERMRRHADEGGARINLNGVTAPNLMDDLDKTLVGRDRLPRLKEQGQIVSERSTNWCIVPAPTRPWAALVFPDLPPDDAYEELWRQIEHVLRLDEADPAAAWDARMATLKDSAQRLSERHFDAIELRGPGTELTVGLLPTARWWAADFTTTKGLRHLPNLPSEEVFTTPDPERTEGFVTSTKPLVLQDGTIVSGLRVRFEAGTAVEIEADENVEALRARLAVDDAGRRLGELALVDGQGRIGPLGTVFYDTLLDENAASHIAFGSGFPFLVDDSEVARVNESATHVDFMIGSPELEVDGLGPDGGRVPVLRGGDWQI
ncbi:MAG: aminopeptidase [Gaiellaceae bacterium]